MPRAACSRFKQSNGSHFLIEGVVAATLIIIFSAALGIYYLFVSPATRLGARSGSPR